MELKVAFSGGFHFCWVYPMVLFFSYIYIASYVHNEYPLGLSNYDYLLLYQ